MMYLKVSLPSNLFYEQYVSKILAEGLHGNFGILPKHCDFVTPLVPGIITIQTKDRYVYIAVGKGLFVKNGSNVSITTHQAMKGDSLVELTQWIHKQILNTNEQEKTARSVLARLEAGAVKQFTQIPKYK